MQPQSKFFLMTMPREGNDEHDLKVEAHSKLLHSFTKLFDNTYVIDFFKYGPVYDSEFKKKFYLGSHMNPAGYILTANMTSAYIDYIIRHNMNDFANVAFIGNN